MNHHRTLARPYAKAIFELAVQQQQLTAWSQLLTLLAKVAENKALQALYQNPHCSSQVLSDIFIEILSVAKVANPQAKNLLALLAQYRRLSLLPAIAQLFEEDKARLEKTLQVTVTSASPVPGALRQQLTQALEIRLQRAVNLQFHLDKALLGGAVIRAGDLVIDGSVRSKLNKLKYALMN